jgi:hypothetical protein
MMVSDNGGLPAEAFLYLSHERLFIDIFLSGSGVGHDESAQGSPYPIFLGEDQHAHLLPFR